VSDGVAVMSAGLCGHGCVRHRSDLSCWQASTLPLPKAVGRGQKA
jgi:hypothetical protein